MPKPKIIVCIPARYGSTRFPAKVLAKDTGKFLIQHVYEQAKLAKLPDRVIIAADDERIAQAAKSFGAECIMTNPDCPSGTDRIAEAVGGLDFDIVVNLQGDEPEIDPANIDTVAKLLVDNPKSSMATLVAEFETKGQIADPNIVKVVVTSIKYRASSIAQYTSQDSVIPYDREQGGIGSVKELFASYRHICLSQRFSAEDYKIAADAFGKTRKTRTIACCRKWLRYTCRKSQIHLCRHRHA